MSMDSRDQLPLDMVEQMLKFTPSSEEAAHLEEHSEEIDSLARADRFLYEISKYDQHFSHYYCRGNRCVQSPGSACGLILHGFQHHIAHYHKNNMF